MMMMAMMLLMMPMMMLVPVEAKWRQGKRARSIVEYDDDDDIEDDNDDNDDDNVGVGPREGEREGGKVERGIYAQQPPPLHLSTLRQKNTSKDSHIIMTGVLRLETKPFLNCCQKNCHCRLQ